MLITANGKEVELAEGTTLPQFLDQRGVHARHIAVAVNGAVIDRGEYASVTLREHDVIEIVRMVGGG